MKTIYKTQISLLQVVSTTLLFTAGSLVYGADVAATANPSPVMWQARTDMKALDLYWGPGGQEHAPKPDFVFVKEETDGTNPKFVVTDAGGTTWKVKLGAETRPETVSARLVWAAGYFASEDYFLAEMKVAGLPARVHRGREWISGGIMHNARLKRDVHEEGVKESDWHWKHDPFTGTREQNGLRALMAMLNNWDLKNVNNAVITEKDGSQRYMVSDLGATFGTSSYAFSHEKAKGNLQSYSNTRFIRKIKADTVDFAAPGLPPFYLVFTPRPFFMRLGMRSLAKNVPRADAKWLGEILMKLDQKQIEDAFRAAGYGDAEIAAFTKILMQRITALDEL